MRKSFFYILIAVLLSSCGMSNNFNQQKFTSLKKIKPSKTEQPLEQNDFDNQFFVQDETEMSEVDFEKSESQTFDEFSPNSENIKTENAAEFDQIREIPERQEIQLSNEKEEMQIITNDKDFDQEDVDRLAKASKILFWIGIGASIVQLLAFIATIIIDIEVALLAGWMPLMFVPLIAGAVAALCLFSAVIISFVYKTKANRRKLNYDRTSWKAVIITGMTVGFVFLGNLFYTFLAFMEEFF